ncbi:MAG TPA: CPXCG motif-containing cysteine-rich protein [Guyparkeria sp.]|nr:CPXCG motif-containing cysteine-rich protein [Guyparkeria sp.]
MRAIVEKSVICPWCGETITLTLDPSAGEQTYVENCSACYQPIVVYLSWDDDGPVLKLRREGDEQFADG